MSVEIDEVFLLKKLDAMRSASKMDDWEDKHRMADDILCDIVNELGPVGWKIVEEFYGMDKWYAWL